MPTSNPLARLARSVFLVLYVAERHPEQEPACDHARGRDLLWLLIPLVGFVIFLATIDDRYARAVADRQRAEGGP